MKKTLILSLLLNFLGIGIFGSFIYKNGGIRSLKLKSNSALDNKHTSNLIYKTQKSIYEILPNDSDEIVFLGNSIIRICEWHELFENSNIKNRGLSGDIISGVQFRLDEIVASQPQKIFIMIGINDVGQNKSVKQIFKEYENLVRELIKKSPTTKIYIQSILPTIKRKNNRKIVEINKILKAMSQELNLTYIDLYSHFTDSSNQLQAELTFDGLHINGKGYLLFKKIIEKHVNE